MELTRSAHRQTFSLVFILSLLFTSSLLFPLESSQAAIPQKVKVLGTLAMYGTAGGALLGAASMAYGMNSRAIFQGASLGLYSGLIFGGYVLWSHSQRTNVSSDEQYPAGTTSPYQEGTGEDKGSYDEHRWIPLETFYTPSSDDWRGRSRERGKTAPIYYLNLIHFQF